METWIENYPIELKLSAMKTQNILFYLLQFITCCIITWKAESTLFAVLAYIEFVIVISGIGKNLVKKLDE